MTSQRDVQPINPKSPLVIAVNPEDILEILKNIIYCSVVEPIHENISQIG